MAVFRIEKNRNYTVMSNYHLRDNSISCKACGLLSKMLALPDDWDYTTRGLAAICKDGLDSIRSALKELERAGYLERRQLRDDHGRMADVEYIIYETSCRSEPRTDLPYTENPNTVEPNTVFPDSDNPDPEKPTQLNTNIPITKKSKTKKSNTDSILPPSPPPKLVADGQKERERIHEQIEYDYLVTPSNQDQVDELVEIMLEVALNCSPTIHIGRNAEYPTNYVQKRMRLITSEHIRKVIDGINETRNEVHNTKAYLLASLFNVSATMDNYYTMRVNHDQYSSL